MNKKLQELETEFDTLLADLKNEDKVIQSMVQYKGYEDYKIATSTNYDSIRIVIAHKKFNWTDFLTVTISEGTDRHDKFDFSHGSGGFKDATVEERLKATMDMFEIVKLLKDDTDRILKYLKIIQDKEVIFRKVRDEFQKLEEEILIDEAITTIRKTHRPIVIANDLVEQVSKDKTKVEMVEIGVNCNNELQQNTYTIENVGDTRVKIEINGQKYSKKDAIAFINRHNFYVAM